MNEKETGVFARQLHRHYQPDDTPYLYTCEDWMFAKNYMMPMERTIDAQAKEIEKLKLRIANAIATGYFDRAVDGATADL